MVDQAIKGDDVIKNPAASAADDVVSEKAFDNFHKELSGERDKSIQNSMDGKSASGANSKEGSAIAGAIAEGIINGIKDGSAKDFMKNGMKESGQEGSLKDFIKNGTKESSQEGTLKDFIKSGMKESVKDGSANDYGKKGDKMSGIADAMGHAIENGKANDNINGLKDILEGFKKMDGVKPLPTGDFLVREDGKESLFTPNGDRVTVNPDGTHVIKGDVKSVESNKLGQTQITFGDGSKVTVDKEGILDVTRGNQTVSFPRWNQNHYKEGIDNQGHMEKMRPGRGSAPYGQPLDGGSSSGGNRGGMERPAKQTEQTLPNIEIKKH